MMNDELKGGESLPALRSTLPVAAEGHNGFSYGRVIVACAFVILCVAYGIQFTFGVFMPALRQSLP